MLRRQSLRLVAAKHHRFRLLGGCPLSASDQGGGTALASHSECCPAPPVGRRVMVLHSRYSHTLRFYIRPHFRKCRAVVALKLHLVPHTAARPSGIGNRPYAKWPALGSGRVSRRRSPVAGAPYAPSPGRPRVVLQSCFQPGAARSVFGQWPAAMFVVSAPAHPRPRRYAALACAVCPSAPQGGSLSTARGQQHCQSAFRRFAAR